MPNRIIREGITTSEALAFVSFPAETLFYRLIVQADDFGLFDGRPVIVRARCMPLRDVTAAEVGGWLRELAEHALILLYEWDGKPYVAIPKFKQRTRNAAPRYPLPDGWLTNDSPLTDNSQSSASVFGGVVVCVDEVGKDGAAPTAHPPAVTLPLNTGEEFPITADQIREFTGLYPAVDVLAQIRKMRGWLLANPANRKTKAGVLRFVTRWLGQEQDKGGKSGAGTPPTSYPNSGKPKGPSESPLEAQLNWISQMVRNGGMTDEDAQAAREKAVEKHRGST